MSRCEKRIIITNYRAARAINPIDLHRIPNTLVVVDGPIQRLQWLTWVQNVAVHLKSGAADVVGDV